MPHWLEERGELSRERARRGTVEKHEKEKENERRRMEWGGRRWGEKERKRRRAIRMNHRVNLEEESIVLMAFKLFGFLGLYFTCCLLVLQDSLSTKYPLLQFVLTEYPLLPQTYFQ